jgi:hypothetical protein
LSNATRGLSGKQYEAALRKELQKIKKELEIPGSHLNKLVTEKSQNKTPTNEGKK